ncbi:chemotaxis protein CheA [Paucibacter sp. Y2R2-4]|uniref:chemotaxis protein CheA n=1 Tax=Paucibacter sp. Y2R2-4 TaxID=2893553 RepID=UPI0021E35A4C|nr:chemotaxis protein CheA [Paucibacter sp. Y2R2-4]MCV2350998.1 chemotaxis protein CheA [Paucibacter sp. Y2R2-4]
MSPNELDASFIATALPAFFSEAHEQLEALEQLLLELEDDSGNRQLLDALFRCAHTIKGSAGLFGLDAVVAFTHHVETELDLLREGRLSLSPAMSTLLLRCKDEILDLLAKAQNQQVDSSDDAQRRGALIEKLQLLGGQTTVATSAHDHASAPNSQPEAQAGGRWHLSLNFRQDAFRSGLDPMALLNYLRGMGEIQQLHCDISRLPGLDALDPESCHLGFEFDFETSADRAAIESAFSFVQEDCDISLQALTAPAQTGAEIAETGADAIKVRPSGPSQAEPLSARSAEPAAAQRNAAAGAPAEEQRFIRVQADRLDAVINLLGELVIASAGATLLARQTRQGALVEANGQISQLVEEIRNGTLQLRMVPIGETFSRFRRVVRDTAAELGKEVQLDIVGGETELDKSVVERIADPLMHLVRNGLDHGLETPAERRAAGKPEQGRLTLSACHEAGSILIRIDDDGRGIHRQKVLQRAWDRGLVEPGMVPNDEDILQLIFAPGFSTAEKITNLSGRGVGMDVVRSNIQALRGSVQITSSEGQGSRIEIRLPLTLAIIDGFLVSVGHSKFVFPLDAVVEVIEDRPSLSSLDERGRGVVELRGQVLPVVGLRKLYALDSPAPERASVVVLQSAGRRYGVQVDALLGQHQTVIKPLGRMFRSLRGMSGSSILGNGEVALIFDVHSLCQLAAAAPTRSALSPSLMSQASL